MFGLNQRNWYANWSWSESSNFKCVMCSIVNTMLAFARIAMCNLIVINCWQSLQSLFLLSFHLYVIITNMCIQCEFKKETRVWLLIHQNKRKYNKTDFRVWLHNYFTFIWYFVHSYSAMDCCTAINFVKHIEINFCPSWRCLRCMMAFAGAFTTNQQFMHPHCTVYYDKGTQKLKIWTKTILTCFTKWLLSSHPWPNMND